MISQRILFNTSTGIAGSQWANPGDVTEITEPRTTLPASEPDNYSSSSSNISIMNKPLLSNDFLGGQTVHNLIIIALLAYIIFKK